MKDPHKMAKSKKRKFMKKPGAIIVKIAAKYEKVINAIIEWNLWIEILSVLKSLILRITISTSTAL